MKRLDLTNRSHGIAATYAAGCRCDLCREAWRSYSHTNIAQAAQRRAHGRAPAVLRDLYPDVWAGLVAACRAEIVAERRAAA